MPKRLVYFVAGMVLTINVLAAPRHQHLHDDIFNEQELHFGIKGGGQLTQYSTTTVQTDHGSIDFLPESSLRPVVGLATKLVYSVVKIEIDFFWNNRGGVLHADDWYQSVALPVLVRLPFEVVKGFEIEPGIGLQPEGVFSGPDTPRRFLLGAVASLGISVDFDPIILDFEGRYVYGFRNMSPLYSGNKVQDGQILFGLMHSF